MSYAQAYVFERGMIEIGEIYKERGRLTIKESQEAIRTLQNYVCCFASIGEKDVRRKKLTEEERQKVTRAIEKGVSIFSTTGEQKMSVLSPLSDQVVIRPLEVEDKTPGGILLPDQAKGKSTRGRVVAVGPGKLMESGIRAEMSVSEGDMVMYTKYAGTDIEVDREEFVILKENELLAIIK